MEVSTLEPILAEHPFFADFDDDELSIIVGCASNMRVNAGDYLWREGEEMKLFYLIRHGELAVQIHGPRRAITIETLGDGEVVGWSWLIPPYRAHVSMKANTLTRLVALDAVCLRGKMEEDHSLGYKLMKRFAEVIVNSFDAARLQLGDIYG